MLSESSAAVVTATLPVVRAHADQITGRFYARMFTAHPELLNLFNRGNQATGRQQAALAASVVAYAGHLTGADATGWTAILDRIAHKHASLGITAGQYPLVGRHLMAAIGEVLGAAVTPQVAAAWDEVYWLMACELVAREARLYTVSGLAGDGAVWRDWRVAGVTPEATGRRLVRPRPGRRRPGAELRPRAVRLGRGGPRRRARPADPSVQPLRPPRRRPLADHRQTGPRHRRRPGRAGLPLPARARRHRRHPAAEPTVRRGQRGGRGRAAAAGQRRDRPHPGDVRPGAPGGHRAGPAGGAGPCRPGRRRPRPPGRAARAARPAAPAATTALVRAEHRRGRHPSRRSPRCPGDGSSRN